MRKANIENQKLKSLLMDLDKKESKLFERVAKDLAKPSRLRREVNLTRINKFTKEDESIIVPGKVLGGGEIDHKVTVYAFKCSSGAASKIQKSGGKVLPIEQITKEPVKGKKIRIIG